jgi:hypothetical protein
MQAIAYRTHLRAMTAARQAAERRRALARSGDREQRRAAEQAFKQDLACINAAHQEWLRDHRLVPDR